MRRLWNGEEVFEESGMFAASDRLGLLCPATKILWVSAHCENTVYEAGRDFICVPGSDELIRPAGSHIPLVPDSILRPTADLRLHPHPQANAIANAVDGGNLMFCNRNEIALRQVDVSYIRIGQGFVSGIDRQLSRLPRTRARLAAGQSLRVTLIGDSISEGYNATEFVKSAPYAPPYMKQVCMELAGRYRAEVPLTNRALASTGIQYAEKIADRWCGDRPDLLVVAYGMNNFSNTPVEDFIAMLEEIIAKGKAASPEMEFLVVTPMTGNPQWRPTVPGPDAIYAQAMRDFVAGQGPETALADVQMVWRKILERKKFYDLTGNGVNHPNDYGHRIYASVILEVLTGESYL